MVLHLQVERPFVLGPLRAEEVFGSGEVPRPDAERVDVRGWAVHAEAVRSERVEVAPWVQVLLDAFRRRPRSAPELKYFVDLAEHLLAPGALLGGLEDVLQMQPGLEVGAELHVHRGRARLGEGLVQRRHGDRPTIVNPTRARGASERQRSNGGAFSPAALLV